MSGTAQVVSKSPSLAERATQSVLWNMALLPARYLLPLVSSIVVVRVLGPERYSLLATLGAITGTVALYADLGMSKAIPKFEAEIKAQWGETGLRDLLGTLITFRLFLFGVVVLGIWVFSTPFLTLFGIGRHQKLYLFLIAVMLLTAAPSGILRGLLIARFRNREINLIELTVTVGAPLLAMVAALAGLDVPGILASSAVVSILQLMLWSWASASLIPWRGFRFFLPGRLGVDWLRRFVAFSGFTYFGLITRYFNELPFAILVMNIFGMQAQVAFLSLASRAVTMVRDLATLPLSYTLAAILGNTFLDHTHQKLRGSYQILTRIYLLSVVPTSLGLALVARPAIGFIYGIEFVPAVPTLRVLAMLVMVGTVIGFQASILLMYERYREVLVTGALGIATVAGLCWLLIPQWGHLGAGVALGIGGLAWHGSGTRVVHRLYGLRYPLNFLGRVLVACLPMLIYWPLRHRIESHWAMLVAYMVFSIVAFVGVLKLQGGVGRAERTLVAESRLPLRHWILRFI